jgi:hypothetical protein
MQHSWVTLDLPNTSVRQIQEKAQEYPENFILYCLDGLTYPQPSVGVLCNDFCERPHQAWPVADMRRQA